MERWACLRCWERMHGRVFDGDKTKERVILLHACVIIDSIDV
jgi:hypothetical protein